MRLLIDILQTHSRQMGSHPEHWLGAASTLERGTTIAVMGRDGREVWQVRGRLRKRWVRQ